MGNCCSPIKKATNKRLPSQVNEGDFEVEEVKLQPIAQKIYVNRSHPNNLSVPRNPPSLL
jgi:hypothetical protein